MLRELQSNLMAPDEFKNLGFAGEKESDSQTKVEETAIHTNHDKGKKIV